MNYPSTHKSLLERVRNGEEIAWSEFYARYAPVIRFAGSLYHFNDFECEDLVQNVMLKFFDAQKKFVYRENQTRFRTWFATVIRSQAVEYIRKAGRGRENPLPCDTAEDPFAQKFLQEWRKVVLQARKEISSRWFEASALHDSPAIPTGSGTLRIVIQDDLGNGYVLSKVKLSWNGAKVMTLHITEKGQGKIRCQIWTGHWHKRGDEEVEVVFDKVLTAPSEKGKAYVYPVGK